MTDAQKVAAHYRRLAAMQDIVSTMHRDEFNAIADVVEAGQKCSDTTEEVDYMNAYDTALAKLAKAVGVEGENNG